MSVSEKQGNVFDTQAQAITIPVNVFGVMGAGLAKACATRYPDAYYHYRRHCRKGAMTLDRLWVYTPSGETRQLIFVPTKHHWREDSDVDQLRRCIEGLARLADHHHYSVVAMVALGCGHGGLDINTDLKPMIGDYLKPLTTEFELWRH